MSVVCNGQYCRHVMKAQGSFMYGRFFCDLVDTIFAWLKQIFTRLNKLKGSGEKRRNSYFGFFKLILCSKVVDFLHVTQHYCIC